MDDSFSAIYDAYGSMVAVTARRIVSDRDIAEDVCQDTWITAFVRLREVRDASRLPVWLHRVAVHSALQRLRSDNRRSRLAERLSRSQSCVYPRDVCFEVDVARALEQLPRRMRAVVVLRLEGWTFAECADELGITVGTAKSQFHKAALRLRPLLLRSLPAQRGYDAA
jgi:RNA polymerase sigma-70 factor (ECF subfamily)